MLSSVRALVLDTNFTTHGVAATLTLPNQDPVDTTVIWQATPLEEDRPTGTDFQRREPRRVLSLPRGVSSSLPRGSIIEAPDAFGGPVKAWRVDGLAAGDTSVWRVIVVQAGC
jgi:hypothetical protein